MERQAWKGQVRRGMDRYGVAGQERKLVSSMKKKPLLREKLQEAFDVLSTESRDGGVSPKSLVDYARSKNSPLHAHFEWDDKKAGERFRVWEARMLLRRMTIEVADVETREYENLTIEVNDKKETAYYSISKILSDDDLKKRVLKQALAQLKIFYEKYSKYKEIYEVIDQSAMEKLERELLTA